jgi:hypothetical protein
MKTVPLEALLRRVARDAEKMFKAKGEVPTFWLCDTAEGEQFGVMTPLEAPMPGREYKRLLARKMRELFREKNVVRYARASEAWMSAEDDNAGWDGGTLATHPRRREGLLFEADDGQEHFTGMREIIRQGDGKAILGKLEVHKDTQQLEGDFFALLSMPETARSTHELPDGEGTLFVTRVPGAPFQLKGRRGPTGELFVKSFLVPRDPGKLLSQEAVERYREEHREEWIEQGHDGEPPTLEIVEGPEAERLIEQARPRFRAQ